MRFRRLTSVALGLLLVSVLLATSVAVEATATGKPAQEEAQEQFAAGRYIVTLVEPAAATYRGGLHGYRSTTPLDDEQLDLGDPAVQDYSRYLVDKQATLAFSVGVDIGYSYTLATNGFTASLTADQARQLAESDAVESLVLDELLELHALPRSTDFLDLTGDDGVWASLGGVENAGDGVVVGMLDTGIAPENPAFAADPLGTVAGADPYLDNDVIVYEKADGHTFRGSCATGEDFATSDCNTKIVGARYYVNGFGADNIATNHFASPRDRIELGHGSHTASTAAGNHNVEATVHGRSAGTFSGVAPAAKISVYKVCWNGKHPNSRDDDGCALSDVIAAIEQSVRDGVDVLNCSIGFSGTASSTVWLSDRAFLGAAAAGIFVAASAGNSGPTVSTVTNNSPWITTVAASTISHERAGLAQIDGAALEEATADSRGEIPDSHNPPAPQIAKFSSRGPLLIDGSDIIKPDIAAPGVSILAAGGNDLTADPTFNISSGTSMAAPHIAGLAAIYLGQQPLASPAEIKSAFMTTAYNTVDSHGNEITDPFVQGAGHVDPTKFFEPGLLYLNDLDDWHSYIEGAGYTLPGVEAPALDPTSLNLASVSVGKLSGIESVTRTVTSTRAGTFTAEIAIPGIEARVVPSTLTFGEAGESQSFEVVLRRTTAPLEKFTTGALNWSSQDTVVHSVIAVRPTSFSATEFVSGSDTSGSVEVAAKHGGGGDIPIESTGLFAGVLHKQGNGEGTDHTGIGSSGAKSQFDLTVPEGARFLRLDLDGIDNRAELKMTIMQRDGNGKIRNYWIAADNSAHQSFELRNPQPGEYTVRVEIAWAQHATAFDLRSYVVGAVGAVGEPLNFDPPVLTSNEGAQMSFTARWQDLAPAHRYLGVISYGTTDEFTLLEVTTGEMSEPPVLTNIVKPFIGGHVATGKTLSAFPGMWDTEGLDFEYQWLKDGSDIVGATSKTFDLTEAEEGTTVAVMVTATRPGLENVSATSAGVFVRYSSSVSVGFDRPFVLTTEVANARVTISTREGSAAAGTVWVKLDGVPIKLTEITPEDNGSVRVALQKLTPGVHSVDVEFRPTNDQIAASESSRKWLWVAY